MNVNVSLIPKDVMLDIFAYLIDSPKDLVVARVCKQWRLYFNEDVLMQRLAAKFSDPQMTSNSRLYAHDWKVKIKSSWTFSLFSVNSFYCNSCIHSCVFWGTIPVLLMTHRENEEGEEKTYYLYNLKERQFITTSCKAAQFYLSKNYLIHSRRTFTRKASKQSLSYRWKAWYERQFHSKEKLMSKQAESSIEDVMTIQSLSTEKNIKIPLLFCPKHILLDFHQQVVAAFNEKEIKFYDVQSGALLHSTEAPPLIFYIYNRIINSKIIFKNPYYITFNVDQNYQFEMRILNFQENTITTQKIDFIFENDNQCKSVFYDYDEEKMILVYNKKMVILNWNNFPHDRCSEAIDMQSQVKSKYFKTHLVLLFHNALLMVLYCSSTNRSIMQIYDIKAKRIIHFTDESRKNIFGKPLPFKIEQIAFSKFKDQIVAYGDFSIYYLTIKNLLMDMYQAKLKPISHERSRLGHDEVNN